MKKGKSSRPLVIGVVVAVVIIILAGAGVFAYYHFWNNKPRFQPRNFQLTPEQISDVTSFFSANPTAESIQSYCVQNRANCFYYCRTINPTNDYCAQLVNQTRPGNFTRGNYSRGNYTRGAYPGGQG